MATEESHFNPSPHPFLRTHSFGVRRASVSGRVIGVRGAITTTVDAFNWHVKLTENRSLNGAISARAFVGRPSSAILCTALPIHVAFHGKLERLRLKPPTRMQSCLSRSICS